MPKLKYAPSGKEFRAEAKDYVINMLSGSRKLHKKNNKSCPWSKSLAKYYDFDTLEEAENSGIEFTRCKNCFK